MLSLAEPHARAQSAPGGNTMISDPTLLAAQRRRRANRTPCSVSYTDGTLPLYRFFLLRGTVIFVMLSFCLFITDFLCFHLYNYLTQRAS